MIPVTRSVEYFNKYNEELEELGTLVGKYDISEIPLRKLKNIVSANEDDIYLFDMYDLNEEQLIKINLLLSQPISYSLDKFDYCLGCAAIKGYYENHKIKGRKKGGYPPPDLG
jgi:hypothetical protein